jgi:predicted Zn finger-like uncharacterized protein
MAVKLTCPDCDAALTVAESSLGKTLRCKYCGETFKATGPKRPAEEEEESRPAKKRPRAAEDDDGGRPRKVRKKGRKPRPKSALPLVLGLAGGLVVLVGVGIGVAYFAGAFGSGKGGNKDMAGGAGSDSATPGKLKFGSPPPQVGTEARIQLQASERGGKPFGPTIQFEILRNPDPGFEYVLVSIEPNGQLDVEPLFDERTGTHSFIPAPARFQVWIGKRKSDGDMLDPGQRVSNVITFGD